MRDIRRILVAVKDPSPRSLPAVAKAAQLAVAVGAHLELFHAIDTSVYADTLGMSQERLGALQREERAQYLQRLERIAARVRLHGAEVSVRAEWDYPGYEAVIREAGRFGADLIVAERHPRRHIAPGLLGLADWELLRLSPMPVLLVKRARPYHRPVILAAVDPTHAFAKPARLDDEILAAGERFGAALRGRLHVMHAYDPLRAGLLSVSGAPVADLEQSVVAESQAAFDRCLKSSGIPSSRRHLVGLHPVDAVVATAREVRGDIVVMGAVSRSGLKRLFIGNTAEELLDRLPCDLLIVKPPRFAARVPRARRGVRLIVLQAPY
ncbi:MAG: universal stress protein [Gammaproteobacteria bacterium]|nr:universal stress protein [Gammaproteobacteria bacterium]